MKCGGWKDACHSDANCVYPVHASTCWNTGGCNAPPPMTTDEKIVVWQDLQAQLFPKLDAEATILKNELLEQSAELVV